MPAYSIRMYAGVPLARSVSLTVPGSKRWVVRCIDTYGSVENWTVINPAGKSLWVVHAPAAGTGQYCGHWEGRQVLYAGETLAIWTNPGSGIQVTVSGYELAL